MFAMGEINEVVDCKMWDRDTKKIHSKFINSVNYVDKI